MLKVFSVAVLFSVIISNVNAVHGQVDNSDKILYESFSECLRMIYLKGDSLKQEKGNLTEIEYLIQKRGSCPDESAITSRVAMKHLEWGDNIYNEKGVSSIDSRRELFDKALKWAKIAVKEDPKDYFGYEVLSMSFAAIVSVSKLKTQAQLADSVRIYAEESIKLNSLNDKGYHILGRWHFEVSRLNLFKKFFSRLFFGTAPSGSLKDSIYYFKKAAETRNIIIHRYWLAMAYLENGEKVAAKEQFELVLELPTNQENDGFFRDKAKEILKNI